MVPATATGGGGHPPRAHYVAMPALALWIGSYPAPAGWDFATAGPEWPEVLMTLAPALGRVCAPTWMRGSVEALAGLIEERERRKVDLSWW